MDNWESVKITYDGKHYKMDNLKCLAFVKFKEGKEFKVEVEREKKC
jgi:hypothetical protein